MLFIVVNQDVYFVDLTHRFKIRHFYIIIVAEVCIYSVLLRTLLLDFQTSYELLVFCFLDPERVKLNNIKRVQRLSRQGATLVLYFQHFFVLLQRAFFVILSPVELILKNLDPIIECVSDK